MRLVVCVLACVGVSGMSLALADPPATSPAPSASAPAPAATPAQPAATPAQPAATPSAPPEAAKTASVVIQSTPEVDTLEKHFLSEGYKIEMHHGEKYFCRREEQLGTRLGGQKVCGTVQELQANERQAQASVDRSSMQQNNPTGMGAAK